MSSIEIKIPDIGTDEKVDVVEVLVAQGESVKVDDGLVTLESDKASMDVPSTHAGVVEKVVVKVGDKVGQGDVIAILEVADDEAEAEEEGAESASDADGGEDSASEPEPESGESEAPTESEPGDAPSDSGEDEVESGRLEAASLAAESPPPPPPKSAADFRKPLAPDADMHAEVLVLGSGPGGYTAAFRAADLGKRVVLVERYSTLGGVCLNVGCIPSKAYLHVARVIEEAVDLGEHGVGFGKPDLELEKLRAWKDQVVGRLTSGLSGMAKKREVEVVTGAGHFTGPHSIDVVDAESRRTISFDHAIIATGSRVIEIPGIPLDDPRIMDSTDALALPEIPERLLIVGGGIIGLEMATVYGALGSKITVVELMDGLIPGCDRDLVKPLERRLKRRYDAEIHVSTKVTKVESDGRTLTAHLEGKRAPESAEFDLALVSVGRRPNSDRINIESTSVKVDDRGFIGVDSQMRTNVDHIFAIGDVVPGPMLAHKATHEGKVAAEAIAGEKSHFDARVIPSVAYTDPEIAWVGLTETAAAESGTSCEVGSFPWTASGRAIGMGRTDGLTKILFDPETKRVLGAGIVGPNAGDLISELALAIEMDCEAGDLALTVHPHPTLSETVAFSAEAFEGTITDLYLKKKQ